MKLLWLAIFFLVFLWSGYEPKDRMIWILEVFPAIIGFIILAATYHSFPLTSITYILILVHMVVLMIGGHYTYAEVPLFDTLNNYFNGNRNNYDKVGHFMQGAVPVVIAREIVIRKNVFTAQNGWFVFFLLCFVLAVSAFYELLEWWSAVLIGSAADEFLATQGYVWDTQSDMWYALMGGITSLAIFSRLHDKKLREIS
ncbi:MAG: DUF2238 domain-containing protein [Campylobacterales bacterium]|nr:DUF2238 domain-containing protein [Campylobacterales bacterium]